MYEEKNMPAQIPQILTDGLRFPEGPVWAPGGTLYVTEIEAAVLPPLHQMAPSDYSLIPAARQMAQRLVLTGICT